MNNDDWLARQIERRRKDNPVSEDVGHAIGSARERLNTAAATRAELLAMIEAEARAEREHRTAVGAAFRELVQSGGSVPRSVIDAAMRHRAKRLDGTTVSLEDRVPERNVATDTDNAMSITHAPVSLED